MNRIIVRAPNWIGDQVLSFPFFYELRRAYPKAWITSVCVQWVAPLQYTPLVNEVIVLPKPTDTAFSARRQALAKGVEQLRGREKGWDLGFLLSPSFSAAWLFYRARVRERVGYAGDGRRLLLTQVPRAQRERAHRAQQYLDLLATVVPRGHVLPRAVDFWPQPPNAELAELRESEGAPGVLTRFDSKLSWQDFAPLDPPSLPGKNRYWVLAPGSQAESRRWGVEKFAELAAIIQRETGWKGIIVGGPTEAPLAQQLVANRSLQLSDWTAQGPVPGLARLFEQAAFTVTNDSGLAHVASLCGSPTCIVWGAGNPQQTAPLGPGRTRIVLSSPECWPCERNTCSLPGEQKLQCLKRVDAQAAWEEIKNGILPFVGDRS